MRFSPPPMRWPRVLVATIGIAVVAGAGPRVHAQTDEPVLDPNATQPANATGQCTATATLSNGFTINPYVSAGVYVVPISGSATYSGSVAVDEGDRLASGKVEIETAPPFPNITLDDQWTWGPRITGVSKGGTVTWGLSDWLPRDVPLTVSGVHKEGLVPFCEGSVQIEFDGSPWDSPITPISVGGTALALGGLAWASRAKGIA